MKHLKMDKHGELAGGHNPQQVERVMVWGLGFGVWGLGFGVWGLGFGVWGLGFGNWGQGAGV